jgi:hypothetical protein
MKRTPSRRRTAADIFDSPGGRKVLQDVEILELSERLGREETLRLLNIACAQKQLLADQQPVPLTEKIQ